MKPAVVGSGRGYSRPRWALEPTIDGGISMAKKPAKKHKTAKMKVKAKKKKA